MRFLDLSIALLASAATLGVAADTGLNIEVTHKVECDRKSKKGDNIAVHYTGTLKDGTVFDSSHNRNQPITFVLGAGRVIKGWDDGLLDMCIDEKRTLTIPPELGYGDRGVGPIPPKSTLTFETELVGIDGVEAPKPAEGATESVKSGASSVASEATEKATEGVKAKVMEKVHEAAEALKVTLEDTDADGMEHNEL